MELPIGPKKEGQELKEAKICGCCGNTHDFVPEAAPFMSGLYWWDCTCGSTLVVEEEHLSTFRGTKALKEVN